MRTAAKQWIEFDAFLLYFNVRTGKELERKIEKNRFD